MVATVDRKPLIRTFRGPFGTVVSVEMRHMGSKVHIRDVIYPYSWSTLRALQEFLVNRELHNNLRQSL